MTDRMEALREASERATPGPWKAGEPAWFRGRVDPADGKRPVTGTSAGVIANVYGEANAELATQSVNFVRDLLSGTWPDKEAVERARIEMLNEGDQTIMDKFEPGELEILIRVGINAALFGGETNSAALGLTLSQEEQGDG